MLYELVSIGILSGILLGITGTYTFVQGINYLAGAISHATMGGIGIALFLQMNYGLNINTFYGALIFAVSFAIIIGIIQMKYKDSDGIIGVAWAMGMSIGLLFLSLSPSFADPSIYLFGNIMLSSQEDIKLIFWTSIIIIILFVLFYNRIVLKLSDESFAKFSGINTTIYTILTLIIVAIIITLMIKIIGIILIIAMLSIPPSIARNYVKKLWQMALLSTVLSIIFNLSGIWISIKYDINSGPSIVLFASFIYFFSFLFLKFKKLLKLKSKFLSILIIFLIFSSCSRTSRSSESSACSGNSCIIKFCPSFEDTTGTICKESVCTIENIPLRYQSDNTTSTSDVSCGPTSVSMLLDGVLEYKTASTGWIENFSNITATNDPTGSSGACGNSLGCRKIVSTEDEMIPPSDAQYATDGASAQEVEDILDSCSSDLGLTSNTTSTYPSASNSSECNFVSGNFKIDNTIKNFNIVLFVRYIKTVSSTTTYNGVPLENISLNTNNGGHFLAMSGYDASGENIFFDFHDPIKGIVKYRIQEVQTDTPFCIQITNGTCQKYQKISFSGTSSFSYLLAVDGEESVTNYNYKIIAYISSIELGN